MRLLSRDEVPNLSTPNSKRFPKRAGSLPEEAFPKPEILSLQPLHSTPSSSCSEITEQVLGQ